MSERGGELRGAPPVWAWHSCGAWQREPTDETIEGLVAEVENRGVVLTLDVPAEFVLLSNYGPWNEIVGLAIEITTQIEKTRIDQAVKVRGLKNVDRQAVRIQLLQSEGFMRHLEDAAYSVLCTKAKRLCEALFTIPENLSDDWSNDWGERDIQACMPCLKTEWIKTWRDYHVHR